jgi:type VII secretion-associated serine protease mycosin
MRSRWLACVTAGLLGAAVALTPAAPAAADPATVRQAQWYLDALRIPAAQQISTGAGVVVAVVDTPIDSRVPDLTGQLLPGLSTVSDSTNGTGQGSATLHGTNMAGLIAGKGGGDMHLLGIAPGAKILPVAVNSGQFGTLGASAHDFDTGIRWAADHGAKVINLSGGAAGPAPPEEVDAVRYALSKDVVVVAAVGNREDSGPDVATPANIPGVIAVSGVAQSGDAWDGSARGAQVTVAAPAVNITSVAPKEFSQSGFSSAEGTSSAAAITSGVVALIRAKFPQLNAANVINRLIATAVDNGNPGRDPIFGFGTIAPLQALTADVPSVSANPLLGSLGAASSAPAGTAAGSPRAFSGMVVTVIAVVVVFLAIVGIVLAVVLSGRRRRPAAPAQRYGPPGYPPAYPPPPGAPPPYGSPPAGPHVYGSPPGAPPVYGSPPPSAGPTWPAQPQSPEERR